MKILSGLIFKFNYFLAMRRFKATLWLLALLLIGVAPTDYLAGQTLNATEKLALEAFDQGDFQAALTHAQALLSIDNSRIDALFMAGQSAFQTGRFDLAEIYFSRIPELNRTGLYTATNLRLAEMSIMQDKCVEAKRLYEAFQQNNLNSEDLFSKTIKEKIEQCQKKEEPAPELVQVEDVQKINIRALEENVNTPKNEIALQRYADKLYFTRAIMLEGSQKPVNRIFTVVRGEPPRPFVENPKQISLQVGNPALTPKADRIYYSICKDSDYTKQEQCQIWYRDRTYDGAWSHPIALPKHINLSGFTATQPNIGFDILSNQEILYFVSDRPGGRGKMDIWATEVRRDGSFGEPINLDCNSPDDDVTPFFHPQEKSLYFSSNREEGLGGFDVYVTEKAVANTWTTPKNLKEVNSTFDDLYFYLHQSSHKAYLSSNRPTSACPDPAASCQNFDLYEVKSFSSLPISVFNAVDSIELKGCNIELMDVETGRIDTTIVGLRTNSAQIPISAGKSFRLIISKPNYYPLFDEIKSQRFNFHSLPEKKVYLIPMQKESIPEQESNGFK